MKRRMLYDSLDIGINQRKIHVFDYLPYAEIEHLQPSNKRYTEEN